MPEAITQSSALTDIGILTENDVTFYASDAFLGAKIRGTDYPRVTLARALPFTLPEHYISVLDPDNKELGIVRALNDFPDEQKMLMREALRLRYFSPVIREIRSVKEKMGYLYMDVRIDGGERVFAVRDYSRNIRSIDAYRLIITDVEGNRYNIENFENMDTKSKRKLEPYLL